MSAKTVVVVGVVVAVVGVLFVVYALPVLEAKKAPPSTPTSDGTTLSYEPQSLYQGVGVNGQLYQGEEQLTKKERSSPVGQRVISSVPVYHGKLSASTKGVSQHHGRYL